MNNPATLKKVKVVKQIDYSKVPPNVWDKEYLEFVTSINYIFSALPRLQNDIIQLEKSIANSEK